MGVSLLRRPPDGPPTTADRAPLEPRRDRSPLSRLPPRHREDSLASPLAPDPSRSAARTRPGRPPSRPDPRLGPRLDQALECRRPRRPDRPPRDDQRRPGSVDAPAAGRVVRGLAAAARRRRLVVRAEGGRLPPGPLGHLGLRPNRLELAASAGLYAPGSPAPPSSGR